MASQVLYATTNKFKSLEVAKLFAQQGIEVVGPEELGIQLEVPQTGKTLEANAALKVRLFAEKLKIITPPVSPSLIKEGEELLPLAKGEGREGLIVMTDDTGLRIDALGDEPGTAMRRWRDGYSPMTDEEIIGYCLEKMQAVPPEARGAEFRTVFTLIFPGSDEIEYFDGRLRGVILNAPQEESQKAGYPFDCLFYIPPWDMVLGQVYQLPEAEKLPYPTNWELALEKVIQRIKTNRV